MLTSLPEALRAYPADRDATTPEAKEAARQAMYDAGFEPGSELLWDLHYRVYRDLTQWIYREELDASYDGALEAGITADCPVFRQARLLERPGDPATRSQALLDAFEGITLTGTLKRPMLSLHGDLDALLPVSLHGER